MLRPPVVVQVDEGKHEAGPASHASQNHHKRQAQGHPKIAVLQHTELAYHPILYLSIPCQSSYVLDAEQLHAAEQVLLCRGLVMLLRC